MPEKYATFRTRSPAPNQVHLRTLASVSQLSNKTRQYVEWRVFLRGSREVKQTVEMTSETPTPQSIAPVLWQRLGDSARNMRRFCESILTQMAVSNPVTCDGCLQVWSHTNHRRLRMTVSLKKHARKGTSERRDEIEKNKKRSLRNVGWGSDRPCGMRNAVQDSRCASRQHHIQKVSKGGYRGRPLYKHGICEALPLFSYLLPLRPLQS